MSAVQTTDHDLYEARKNLGTYIRTRAAQTAAELRFGWVPVEHSPSTYQALRGAFTHSERTGEPLPVYSLHSEDTVFLQPEDNFALRFFHDVHHVRLGVSFALEDEWELALWHLKDLEKAGYGQNTMEYRLLQADTVGQNVVLGIAGRFPINQGEFTRTCARIGLEAGILREIRKVSP